MACRWSRSLSCLRLPASALFQMPLAAIGGEDEEQEEVEEEDAALSICMPGRAGREPVKC